ncbi:hypothetical protein [Paracoccus sp. MC1862]|uniref:hypothetical protein n=1 Tax=Paracoccus sp. MC1862 TaxID=2760307 RepID=UPI00351C58C1
MARNFHAGRNFRAKSAPFHCPGKPGHENLVVIDQQKAGIVANAGRILCVHPDLAAMAVFMIRILPIQQPDQAASTKQAI